MTALRLHVRCALCGREVPIREGVVAQHRGTVERLGVCNGSGAIPTPEALSAWLDAFSLATRNRVAAVESEAERAADAARRAQTEATATLAWVGRQRQALDGGGAS